MAGTRFGELAWVGLVGVALGAFAWVVSVVGPRPDVPRANGGPTDDGVPSGTVAFFAGGACPSGWQVSEKAQGRLVVGAVDGTTVGQQVGIPLADREDRVHNHDFFGNVSLPGKGVAGASGGGNNGAKAMSYSVAGTSESVPTGLPFVQMQACVKP
ncbi:Hypothetical protein A7982_03592 [Minicystis rosea]|nr:Hypothetical protein A7982_03592 [Minicystis rosea]